MAGSELQVLSIRVDDIDGGEIPMSGMQRDGEGLDTPLKNYLLDPFRLMAAISLMTEEHRLRIKELEQEHQGNAKAYVAAVSEYLVAAIGRERIEVRYELMQSGEYPWWPQI